MTLYRFAVLIWIVGASLIALSWIDVVTKDVAWVGFGIAVFAVILTASPNIRHWLRMRSKGSPPSDDFAGR
jgi:hypothetical protein